MSHGLPPTPEHQHHTMVSSLIPVLSIENLYTSFGPPDSPVYAVNGVSLSVHRGETVALVGESGSGKSVTALSIMRLVPSPGRIERGLIRFESLDLCGLSERDMRAIRGRRISMIFQDPMTSLNPVLRIGDQLAEPLILHRGMSRVEASRWCVDLLGRVGISSPQERLRDYPHQLSGGMRQRVMIAMALACEPSLLIADEPTTALDVTIQAQILELIDSLRHSTDMGLLLITHDLAIVSERSDTTYVMYAGHILESAKTPEIMSRPLHPYTRALLASLPQNSTPGQPLPVIGGQVPVPGSTGPGCVFCGRCPDRLPVCTHQIPPSRELTPGHLVSCWKYE